MSYPHTSLIGAHVSIAGGIQNAPIRAQEEGLETFQCFTRSPQGGAAAPLTDELVAEFKSNMSTAGISRFHIHAPYYINTASPEARIRHSSIRILREELERGSTLGASYVMYHPGSAKDRVLEEAVADASDAIASILKDYKGTCQLLVEISAGAGDVLGDTFEEVGAIIGPIQKLHGFGGICFDTCHAFASGYDVRTPEATKEVLRVFDNTIGLRWLKLSHVNDSKVNLGERKDRHEHIGAGHIGKDGLANILTADAFQRIDWILETESDERANDVKQLREIRGSK